MIYHNIHYTYSFIDDKYLVYVKIILCFILFIYCVYTIILYIFKVNYKTNLNFICIIICIAFIYQI